MSEEQNRSSGKDYRICNRNYPDKPGAFGALLVSRSSDECYVLTCSHVVLGGSGADLGGFTEDGPDVDLEKDAEHLTGNVRYAHLGKTEDAALILVSGTDSIKLGNEIKPGVFFQPAVSMDDLVAGDSVFFFSPEKGQIIEAFATSIPSDQKVQLRYSDRVRSFYNLIALKSSPTGGGNVSEPGDSGSVVFTKDYQPFAMVIGRTDEASYAIPILPVLDATNTQIYSV